MTPEPFVSAETAAEFVLVKRRYRFALARRGLAGVYASGTGAERTIWVFRLSELAAAVADRKRPITKSAKYGRGRALDPGSANRERSVPIPAFQKFLYHGCGSASKSCR